MYALSDRASNLSASPPPRQRSAHPPLESHLPHGGDSESASIQDTEGHHHDVIEEVSEPVSPEGGPSSGKSPGTSVLTSMLKHFPQNRLWLEGEAEGNDKLLEIGSPEEVGLDKGRLIITPNGLRKEPSEQTPLLRKTTTIETPHPNWIGGQRDLEGQIKRTPWLRQVQQQGLKFVYRVATPKSWDRKAIFQNTVVAPIRCLPAVILGLLLNNLDALSYGKSNW